MMWIFQGPYDAIRNWRAPTWLKIILQELNNLMIALLKQASQQYINYLKAEIVYAAGQDWSNEKKFDYVFGKAKQGLITFSIILRDSEINLLIEYFVNLLKKNGAI